jgi:hypothetical protein
MNMINSGEKHHNDSFRFLKGFHWFDKISENEVISVSDMFGLGGLYSCLAKTKQFSFILQLE